LSGLSDSISATAATTAGFWVFAAFVPVLIVGADLRLAIHGSQRGARLEHVALTASDRVAFVPLR
jgi:hypothetical protein